MGICVKLSEHNESQICDKFATILRTLPLMYEAKCQLRKFGAQFATNLHNAPLVNAPFSGLLIFRDGATTIKYKICVFEGREIRGREQYRAKRLFFSWETP